MCNFFPEYALSELIIPIIDQLTTLCTLRQVSKKIHSEVKKRLNGERFTEILSMIHSLEGYVHCLPSPLSRDFSLSEWEKYSYFSNNFPRWLKERYKIIFGLFGSDDSTSPVPLYIPLRNGKSEIIDEKRHVPHQLAYPKKENDLYCVIVRWYSTTNPRIPPQISINVNKVMNFEMENRLTSLTYCVRPTLSIFSEEFNAENPIIPIIMWNMLCKCNQYALQKNQSIPSLPVICDDMYEGDEYMNLKMSEIIEYLYPPHILTAQIKR